VVIILDNGTTAMTGMQDHPGTGYTLGGAATTRMNFEAVAAAMGIQKVHTLGRNTTVDDLETLLRDSLAGNHLTLIVVRAPCLLTARNINEREKTAKSA
jgi:indolepyruvate ferredoxin oxidoreductase alpha subunit